jgi:putative endonuclease
MLLLNRVWPCFPCPVKLFEEAMYYTYVLKSIKDNLLYVGFSKDLKQRLELHERGAVESTRERRPFKLIYYEACIDKNDAIRREKYLKSYHGKMFLKKRLKSYLTG